MNTASEKAIAEAAGKAVSFGAKAGLTAGVTLLSHGSLPAPATAAMAEVLDELTGKQVEKAAKAATAFSLATGKKTVFAVASKVTGTPSKDKKPPTSGKEAASVTNEAACKRQRRAPAEPEVKSLNGKSRSDAPVAPETDQKNQKGSVSPRCN